MCDKATCIACIRSAEFKAEKERNLPAPTCKQTLGSLIKEKLIEKNVRMLGDKDQETLAALKAAMVSLTPAIRNRHFLAGKKVKDGVGGFDDGYETLMSIESEILRLIAYLEGKE